MRTTEEKLTLEAMNFVKKGENIKAKKLLINYSDTFDLIEKLELDIKKYYNKNYVQQ